jgi:hypothetical protein
MADEHTISIAATEAAAAAPIVQHVDEPLVKPSSASDRLPLGVALSMREEAKFLTEKMNIEPLETSAAGEDVTIALPPKIKGSDAVKQYMAEYLPDIAYFSKGTTPEGREKVKVNTFLLRSATRTTQWPVGRRAQPDLNDDQRMEMENDFRLLLGVPLRSKLAESEDLLHKDLSDALAALKLQKQINFGQYMKHGVYHLPISEKTSAAEKIVAVALEHGLLKPDQAEFSVADNGLRQIELTPLGLRNVVNWVANGLKNEKGEVLVPAADAPEHIAARDHFLRSLRKSVALTGMNSYIEAELTPDALKAARAQSGLPEAAFADIGQFSREQTAKYNTALQAALGEQKKDMLPAVNYDRDAMREALRGAQRLVEESRYWKALDSAQAVSGHNNIREVLRHDVADLYTILADDAMTQDGLNWLVNHSIYGESLRTIGHLMQVADRTPKNEKGKELSANGKLGAESFVQAFHFTNVALEPRGDNAKQASYYLRHHLGDTSISEEIWRNVGVGIKPIIHSLEPAKDKPLLAGGAVLGLALWSAYAPPKLSPYALLSDWGHDLMHRFENQSAHPISGREHKIITSLRGTVKRLQDELDTMSKVKGGGFDRGLKAGYWSGLGTAGGLFAAFQIVEDVIVHVPLALVSVTVGFIGAGGYNVLKSMFADLGDIAYKFFPGATHAAESDAKTVAKMWNSAAPLKQFGEGLNAFYHDVDDMGVVSTLRHKVHQATNAFRTVGNQVQKEEKLALQQQGGRAMA